MAYATLDQLYARMPDFDIIADAAAVQPLLDEASEYIDGELRLPGDDTSVEMFHVVTGLDVATARLFWATGSAFLQIDPFVGPLDVDAVTVASGSSPNGWVETGGGLLATDSIGQKSPWEVWPTQSLVTVTAKWGYSAVPLDIVSATLDLAQAAYIHSYASSDSTRLPGGVPERVAQTIERHRMRRALEVML